MSANIMQPVVHLYRSGKPDLTLGMHKRDGNRDGKLQLMEGLEGRKHCLQKKGGRLL